MLIKNVSLCALALVASVESVKTSFQTFDDYVDAIRKAAHMPGFGNDEAKIQPSLLEVENLKKPLTVSQFSEWLHNLYYDEEKKRKSAIKYMLENQFRMDKSPQE